MFLQPVTPLIYEVVGPSTGQATVADTLLGAAVVLGALAASALVLGLLFTVALIAIRRLRGHDKLAGGGSDSVRLGLRTPLRASVASPDAIPKLPGPSTEDLRKSTGP